jgi:hypothetical protein
MKRTQYGRGLKMGHAAGRTLRPIQTTRVRTRFRIRGPADKNRMDRPIKDALKSYDIWYHEESRVTRASVDPCCPSNHFFHS